MSTTAQRIPLQVHPQTAHDDALHERRIASIKRRHIAAMQLPDKRLANALWAAMTSMVNARSPQQIAFMEIQRGLRRG